MLLRQYQQITLNKLLAILFNILSIISFVYFVILLMELINLLIQEASVSYSMILYIAVLLSGRYIFQEASQLMMSVEATRVTNKWSNIIINSIPLVDRLEAGELQHQLTFVLDKTKQYVTNYQFTAILSIMTLVIMFGVTLYYHWVAAIILIVTSPFIPLLYIVVGMKTQDDAKTQMNELNKFQFTLMNTLRSMDDVVNLNLQQHVVNRLKSYNSKYVNASMKLLKTVFVSGFMLDFITMISIGLVALELGFELVVFKTIEFESAFIVMMVVPEFYLALKNLSQSFHAKKESMGQIELLDSTYDQLIIDRKNSRYIDIVVNGEKLSGTNNFSDGNLHKGIAVNLEAHDIKLEDKSIHYPKVELDFSQFNVIIGRNGVGKSLYLQLLNDSIKFYQSQSVSYLPQHSYIFEGTFKENIGNKSYDECAHYIKMLKLDTICERFGYHDGLIDPTIISHGEQKRINILRVLMDNKPFVILDEPLAGLNIELKQSVLKCLLKLITEQHKCVVMVTHELSLVKQRVKPLNVIDFDQIDQLEVHHDE